MSVTLPLLAFVAGEASGDRLGAPVLARFLSAAPGRRALGVGGEALAATGAEVRWSYAPLAVHGFSEALVRLWSLLRFRRSLAEAFVAAGASAFLGIDAPDFNLGLAQRLRAGGVRTAQLVSPAVWAWRPWRVKAVARAVERVFCLFPFEPDCYRGLPVVAEYVGHPLADALPLRPDRAAARAELGLPNDAPVLAVLPGSRAGEWQRHGAIFLAAAERVAQALPGLHVVLPTADALGDAQAAFWQQRWRTPAPLQVVPRASLAAMTAADVVLVASGTATLEAALLKRPMVIAYRVSAWQYRLMRRLARVRWIGLPNLLMNEAIVPELLQEEATPARLAAAVLHWFEASQAVAELEERFSALHERLRRGMAGTVAARLEEMMACAS